MIPIDQRTSMGFLVGGYSAGDDEPHVYVMTLGENGTAPDPVEVLANDTGSQWWGQPEALARLLTGLSIWAPKGLENIGVGADEPDRVRIANALRAQVQVPLNPAAMPIQDAIDLAHFMVDTTIKFVRFMPGEKVVGGPIEIATITKHEGFRWVSR